MWYLRVYERINIKNLEADGKKINDLVEQEYAIIRDLHCWTVEITYNVNVKGGESIWVVFNLKAFPDLPIEYGTSYHEPKAGSQFQY